MSTRSLLRWRGSEGVASREKDRRDKIWGLAFILPINIRFHGMEFDGRSGTYRAYEYGSDDRISRPHAQDREDGLNLSRDHNGENSNYRPHEFDGCNGNDRPHEHDNSENGLNGPHELGSEIGNYRFHAPYSENVDYRFHEPEIYQQRDAPMEYELDGTESTAEEMEAIGNRVQGMERNENGEAEMENTGNTAEDQRNSRRLKALQFLSALGAALSTVSVSLTSLIHILLGDPVGSSTAGSPLLGSTSSAGLPMSHSLYQFRRRSSSISTELVWMFMFLRMMRMRGTPRMVEAPWYIKPRSLQWFVSFLDFSPREDPEKFKEYFRISPDLFYHICEMLAEEMVTDPPTALRVLPNRVLIVERQVALAIRRLATGDQFVGIAELFGVSKSTAVKVTWKFILAFNKKARHHLQWPQGERLQQVKDGFQTRWGFPNCCGALDGTHFPVELSNGENVSAYLDYKQNASVSMQAIADQDLRFLDVVVGWPGSIQDIGLMEKSNFFKSVVYTKTRLNGSPFTCLDGSLLREYIIGDAGYPLFDWLIVPFPSGMSPVQDEWNSRHSSARICVEGAFGRLKGTWKILSRILWKPRKERIGPMILACCLLHNMIIDLRDTLNPQVYAGVSAHPGGYESVLRPTNAFFEGGPETRHVIFNEVMRFPN